MLKGMPCSKYGLKMSANAKTSDLSKKFRLASLDSFLCDIKIFLTDRKQLFPIRILSCGEFTILSVGCIPSV